MCVAGMVSSKGRVLCRELLQKSCGVAHLKTISTRPRRLYFTPQQTHAYVYLSMDNYASRHVYLDLLHFLQLDEREWPTVIKTISDLVAGPREEHHSRPWWRAPPSPLRGIGWYAPPSACVIHLTGTSYEVENIYISGTSHFNLLGC